jgi:hypothetical protein
MSDTFKAVWYAAAVSRFLIVNKTARPKADDYVVVRMKEDGRKLAIERYKGQPRHGVVVFLSPYNLSPVSA